MALAFLRSHGFAGGVGLDFDGLTGSIDVDFLDINRFRSGIDCGKYQKISSGLYDSNHKNIRQTTAK
jgi:hypothetical protein